MCIQAGSLKTNKQTKKTNKTKKPNSENCLGNRQANLQVNTYSIGQSSQLKSLNDNSQISTHMIILKKITCILDLNIYIYILLSNDGYYT